MLYPNAIRSIASPPHIFDRSAILLPVMWKPSIPRAKVCQNISVMRIITSGTNNYLRFEFLHDGFNNLIKYVFIRLKIGIGRHRQVNSISLSCASSDFVSKSSTGIEYRLSKPLNREILAQKLPKYLVSFPRKGCPSPKSYLLKSSLKMTAVFSFILHARHS